MNTMTVVGNVTADPELRYTPTGKAILSLRIAENRKRGDETETAFWSVTVWEDHAENAAESLKKGDRVIVHGALRQRESERDGNKRTFYDLDAYEIGVTLRWATVSGITRTGNRNSNTSQAPAQPPAADDEAVF